MSMTAADTLDLLGSEAREQLRRIVTEMLQGVEKTTVEPEVLVYIFNHPGPKLDKLNWYDLLAAAAEVVSDGRMTIRRADSRLFQTEVLGSARYVAVLPAAGAPDKVCAGHSYESLYFSSVPLKFCREHPQATG